MKGPNSFTGEDVVEISCHGNPIIIQHVIELCLKQGARLARAGEFSRRAATNGKLFFQAESLSALLTAKSRGAVVASQRGMTGEIENKLDRIQDRLWIMLLKSKLDWITPTETCRMWMTNLLQIFEWFCRRAQSACRCVVRVDFSSVVPLL